jgi:hypothetical protein
MYIHTYICIYTHGYKCIYKYVHFIYEYREVSSAINCLSSVEENKAEIADRALCTVIGLMLSGDMVIERHAVCAAANLMEGILVPMSACVMIMHYVSRSFTSCLSCLFRTSLCVLRTHIESRFCNPHVVILLN